MSAWMVSDAHIDLIATAWVAMIDPTADPQAIGAQMARDNATAIRERYEDRHGCAADAEAQAAAYRFRPWPGTIDPMFLAKQVACYRYQCAEGDDWKGRAGVQAAGYLLARLAVLGADWDGKPLRGHGADPFDAFPWGVDEEHRPGKAFVHFDHKAEMFNVMLGEQVLARFQPDREWDNDRQAYGAATVMGKHEASLEAERMVEMLHHLQHPKLPIVEPQLPPLMAFWQAINRECADMGLREPTYGEARCLFDEAIDACLSKGAKPAGEAAPN